MPLSTVLSTGHDGTDFVADRGSYGVPDRRAHLVADDGTSLLAVHAGWDLLRVRHLQLPAGVASSGDRRAHLVADVSANVRSYGVPDERTDVHSDRSTTFLGLHTRWAVLRM